MDLFQYCFLVQSEAVHGHDSKIQVTFVLCAVLMTQIHPRFMRMPCSQRCWFRSVWTWSWRVRNCATASPGTRTVSGPKFCRVSWFDSVVRHQAGKQNVGSIPLFGSPFSSDFAPHVEVEVMEVCPP